MKDRIDFWSNSKVLLDVDNSRIIFELNSYITAGAVQ